MHAHAEKLRHRVGNCRADVTRTRHRGSQGKKSNGGLCPPVLGLVALVCSTGPPHQAAPPGTPSTPTGTSMGLLASDSSGLGHQWPAVSALLPLKTPEKQNIQTLTQVIRELRERTAAKRPDSGGRRPSYAMAILLDRKPTRGVHTST